MTLWRKALAELLGTAGLLCAVIGSGIMAERLAGGNAGIALLANTLATVFALYVLIEVLAPISGAHFNPVVTLVMWSRRALGGLALDFGRTVDCVPARRRHCRRAGWPMPCLTYPFCRPAAKCAKAGAVDC